MNDTGGIAIRARDADQAPAADQPQSEQERARLLATGKEIFLLVAPVATTSAATSR